MATRPRWRWPNGPRLAGRVPGVRPSRRLV